MKKIVFSIKKDEEIISSIFNFCKENGIQSAWINGIGAVKSVSLSSYDIDSKKYTKKSLSGKFELTGLSGNIGVLDQKPVIHLHAILADEKLNSFGGHLDKAIVSVTCEVILIETDNTIKRYFDPKVGLNLIG